VVIFAKLPPLYHPPLPGYKALKIVQKRAVWMVVKTVAVSIILLQPMATQIVNSTAKTANRKAAKPDKATPDFPLYPHASGQWSKKICGQHHDFSLWDDPDGALQDFLKRKDVLYGKKKGKFVATAT
jgi:hypothetical protein